MSWQYVITDSYPGYGSSEYENNADMFASYFSGYMTVEAMAGILGNIQYESFMNPGQQELNRNGSTQYGYGLIQWTPASTFIAWCNDRGLDWYDGDAQCYRIKCEGERTDGASGYWLKNSAHGYVYTWSEFCQLTDYEEACKAYFWERERGTWVDDRLDMAENWYNYLNGSVPIPDPGPEPPDPGPSPSEYPLYYFGGVRDLMRRGVISDGKL